MIVIKATGKAAIWTVSEEIISPDMPFINVENSETTPLKIDEAAEAASGDRCDRVSEIHVLIDSNADEIVSLYMDGISVTN